MMDRKTIEKVFIWGEQRKSVLAKWVIKYFKREEKGNVYNINEKVKKAFKEINREIELDQNAKRIKEKLWKVCLIWN